MPSNATDAWSYEVRGGAGDRRKVENSRASCVGCGENMRKTERKHARFYAFRPARDVWRRCRKRSILKCNEWQWRNYRIGLRRRYQPGEEAEMASFSPNQASVSTSHSSSISGSRIFSDTPSQMW